MTKLAAKLFAVLCGGVIIFQFALILGAPLGALTQGGATEGVLPARGRFLAGLSVLVLTLQALIVLRKAEVININQRVFGRLGYPFVLVVSTLALLANLATPSAAERALWAPVTAVMLALVLFVWWHTRKIRAKSLEN